MTALVNPYWYGVGGDPLFASVVLLLHCDEANGATTLVDASAAARSVTCTGGHVISTAQSKFGTASLDCQASANGRASAADSADWHFGAGQFTIECWIRPSVAISGARSLMGQWGVAPNLGWTIIFSSTSGNFSFQYSTTGSDSPAVSFAYLPPVTTWTHIVVDRDASNVLRTYADGVVKGSATVAATLFNSANQLQIGNDISTRAFNGYMDEIRITKGAARYAGAFTPPAAPFPDT